MSTVKVSLKFLFIIMNIIINVTRSEEKKQKIEVMLVIFGMKMQHGAQLTFYILNH